MGSPEVQDQGRNMHRGIFCGEGSWVQPSARGQEGVISTLGCSHTSRSRAQLVALPSLCVILTVLKEQAVGSQVAECVVVIVLPGKANRYHQPQQSKCDRNRERVGQSASVVTASAGKTGNLSLISPGHTW